jgi:methionyl-tRNA synthetase
MRLGVGEYKLPDFIPTRGYFLLEGQKFSKSRGWYVSLREFLNRFPADYLRFYLAAITPYSQLDVNFSWEDFKNRINNELIANVGNFIHRTLTFIWTNYEGEVPKPEAYDDLDNEFRESIQKIAANVAMEIENNELSRGLKTIMEFSTVCNQYFQRNQPWKDKAKAKTCLCLCANAVRTLAILLEPYIPFSAEGLWQQLNLDGSVHKQDWDSASRLSMPEGHRINQPKVLFQKIQAEEIEQLRSQGSSSKRPEPTVLRRP